jgi:hypothetical protein
VKSDIIHNLQEKLSAKMIQVKNANETQIKSVQVSLMTSLRQDLHVVMDQVKGDLASTSRRDMNQKLQEV